MPEEIKLDEAVTRAKSFLAAPESFTWIQLLDLHRFLNSIVDAAVASPLMAAVESEKIGFLKRARCTALQMLAQP